MLNWQQIWYRIEAPYLKLHASVHDAEEGSGSLANHSACLPKKLLLGFNTGPSLPASPNKLPDQNVRYKHGSKVL